MMLERRRARLGLAAALSLTLVLGLMGSAGPGFGPGRVRAPGASYSAPSQRGGSAVGEGHRVDTAATATGLASTGRHQPRPPGAVPDRLVLPAWHAGKPAGPQRLVHPVVVRSQPAAGLDARTSRELIGQRDATARLYRNADGTRTLRLYTEQVNVRAGDGSWTPVDPTLVVDGDRLRSRLVSQPLSFAMRADADVLAELVVDDGHSFGFGLHDARPVRAGTVGEQASYAGVRPGVDLRLTAASGSVKEHLVLASAQAAAGGFVFPLRLRGLTPVGEPAGGVRLVDEHGAVRATIPPGYLVDARGAMSTGVSYRLEQDPAGRWSLRVTADAGWLGAPERAYPVDLDPSVSINTGSDDTFVMAGHGDESGAPDLQVGTEDGGRHIGRAYFHFNDLASRLRNQYVTGASLVVDNTWAASCTAKPVTLFEVAVPWSGAMRWPGAPVNKAYDTRSFAHRGTGGGCPADWEPLRVDADDATRWTHGAPFHGLSLRASNEQDSEAFKRFAAANSANPPHLDVTYSPEGAGYEVDEVLQPTNTTPGHVKARVTNLGASVWPAGGGFRFGLTVKQGDRVVATSPPVAPSGDVSPMGTAAIQVPVPPLPPGEYLIELNMVDPQGRDFRTAYGVPAGLVPFKVTNVAPAVNFEQPGTGASVGSITPTLYAEGVNPDNWPANSELRYDFKICAGTPDAPVDCRQSGWIGQTWTPPVGALRWSTTFHWWVRAHDGADPGPYTGPLALTTEVPQPEITGHLAGSPDSVQGPGLDAGIGNYSTVATDASVPTVGPDLTITRTYNSLDPRRDSAFGVGWASRIDMRLTKDADGSGNVLVTFPTGRQVRFGRNADATFAAPAGQALTLVYDSAAGRWTLRDSSGSRWLFDVLGRLVTAVDAYGLTETLRYDTADHVVEIVNDTSRRRLTVTWVGGRVATVQANGGPTWTYQYEGDHLAAACAPGPAPNCTRYGYGTGSHYRSSVLDDRPRGYWRLGEASGAVAASASARREGADAGRYAGVVLGADGALAGTQDMAAVFDGANSYLALPEKLTARSMSLSAELWFKTTGSGVLLSAQNGPPFPDRSGTGWTPVLYVGTDGRLYGGFNAPRPTGPRQAVSDTEVNDGQWHHVVLAAAIDTQTLYVDGNPQQVTATGVIDHRGQSQLAVGAGRGENWPATNGAAFYFPGSIDEVALYEHTLGELAARDHFAAARAIDQLTDVTLPQDDRRYAHLTYDDLNDRVRTLDDHWGRTWRLDAPTRDDATRSVTLHGPYPDWVYTFDTDHGGRIVSRTHDGGTQRYEYNTAGFLAKLVDENNHEATFTTDARGNVLSTTTCRAPGSCHTSYSSYVVNSADPLDPRNDRLSSGSDARSSGPDDTRYRTTYEYDPAGRLTKVTSPVPEGAPGRPVETWAYAAGTEPADGGGTVPAGSLLTYTGRRGQLTTYAYTATGDLALVTSPTGLRTRYRYDTQGRPAEVTTANAGGVAFGTTTLTYTERSEPATVTEPAVVNPISGIRHQRVTTSTYDGNGSQTSVTIADATPAGAGGDAARTTTVAYDEHDRPRLVTYPDGSTQTRAYASAGLEIVTTDQAGTVWRDLYDDQRRLLRRTASGTGVDPQDPAATSLVLEWRGYDPAGRLAAVTDAMGRLTRYTYYDDDLLATATREGYHNPDGTVRDVVLEQRGYDPAGQLTSLVGAGGVTRTYGYDAAGYVSREVFDPAALARTAEYTRDLGGNATRVRLTGAAQPGRVEVTDYSYGPDDQPTRADATLSSGVTLSTVVGYDERGLPTSERNARNFTTNHTYDALGEPVSTVEPAADVWVAGSRTPGVRPTTTVGRNVFGEVTHDRDPNGTVTTVAFNAVGLPETITAPPYTPPGGTPVTAATRVGYDRLGRPNKVTDPLGRVTEATYDPYGSVLTRTLPKVGDQPSTTSYTYDRDGEPLSRTSPSGAQTRATYDELGRPVTVTAVERVPGPVAYFTAVADYDDAGNATAITTPEGHITSRAYNAAGETTSETDPTNRTTTFGYDIAGRPASVTEPGGLVTEVTYDLLGRPTGLAQRKGQTVLRSSTTDFDADGNVVNETSAEGRRRTFGYDAGDRLVTQTARVDATKTISIALGYDAAGNQTRYVDGNGHATDYTHNSWGLPESTVEPATAATPDLASRTWTTVYDAAAQAVTDRLPGGVVQTMGYDPQGRLTTEGGSGAEADTAGRDLGYDPDGRINRVGGTRGETTYRYNDRGGLVEARGAAGDATFTYSGDGNLAARVDATGTTTFDYDAAGRPKSMADPVTARTVDYGYDAAGRLATVTDRAVRATTRRTLAYDDVGRVRSDNLTQTIDIGVPPRVVLGTGYSYDRDDLITTKTTTSPTGTETNGYGYDGAGRLTSWTAPNGTVTGYGWDDAGNRTRAGGSTYTYDERDRLVTDGTSTYTYAPRGTLAAVRPVSGGPTVAAENRTLRFDAFERLVADGDAQYGYDSLDRVATRNGAAFQYSGLGNEVIADGSRMLSRDAEGEPFADRATGSTTGKMLYADQHGDVTARYLSATVAGTSGYDPFGRPTASTGEKPAVGYQGGYTDADSGAVNMAARWYDASTGTFLSRDTWTLTPEAGGAGNRYAYGDGDPVGSTDPTGHYCEKPTKGCKPLPRTQPKTGTRTAPKAGPRGGGGVLMYELYCEFGPIDWVVKTCPMDWERQLTRKHVKVPTDAEEARDIRRHPAQWPAQPGTGTGSGGDGSATGRPGASGSGRGRPPAPPPPWIPPLFKRLARPAPAATVAPRPLTVRVARPDTRVIDPGPSLTADSATITPAPPGPPAPPTAAASPDGRGFDLHRIVAFGLRVAQAVEASGVAPRPVALQTQDDCKFDVDYGSLDARKRPTGIHARLCGEIPDGSEAAPWIYPPGWPFKNGKPNNPCVVPGKCTFARGHLLANMLGGSGKERRNLVTLYQYPVNAPIMEGYEFQTKAAVEGGDDVDYQVSPIYCSSGGRPNAIYLQATGKKGSIDLDKVIRNTPRGRVTNAVTVDVARAVVCR